MKNKDSLYSQLIDSLVEEIRFMKPGDRIPSERQLCEIYNISRTTVRNAITDLDHRGLVRRVQGKGTFVREPANRRLNLSNYYSFTDATRQLGKTPRTVILEYHITEAGAERSTIMGLDKETLVIEILRLRLADEEPMLLERTWIPYEPFPDITKFLLEAQPLYSIFGDYYHCRIAKVNEQFSVGQLERRQAGLLKEPANQPCLHITRHSYDENGRMIEYTESVASGSKFNYETTYIPQ